MSTFRPNTTVSIYRTQATENVYGETLDDNTTPAASGLPAYIQEGWSDISGRRTQNRASSTSLRGTLLEMFTIRLRPNVDVQEGDRVLDTRNDLWFQVRDVVRPYTVVGYADIRVGATRIGDVSQPVNG